MRQYSIFALVGILILIIGFQYYILREGFDTDIREVIETPISAPSQTSDNQPESDDQGEMVINAIKGVIMESPEAKEAQQKQERAKLLRDIQQVVHNEVASQKSMTKGAQAFFQQNPDGSSTYSDGSPAEKQGCEMYGVRPKWCPKDMNEYIRKDSIPCWNCSLDY
jgi:hypothetical protein